MANEITTRSMLRRALNIITAQNNRIRDTCSSQQEWMREGVMFEQELSDYIDALPQKGESEKEPRKEITVYNLSGKMRDLSPSIGMLESSDNYMLDRFFEWFILATEALHELNGLPNPLLHKEKSDGN